LKDGGTQKNNNQKGSLGEKTVRARKKKHEKKKTTDQVN
jgi:hypothetical protein